MKKYSIAILTLLCVTNLSWSSIVNVPGDAEGIQAGIDIAVDGDTVLVAPGTYYENIRFMGKAITVASHFILDDEPSFILTTVINGSQPVYPDTASCVLFIHGEDSTSVLAGFTITGGTGTAWEDEHYLNHWYTEGGGVLVQYASPTIRNNLIINNEAIAVPTGITSAGGGAIRSGDSNPHILHNIIMNNQGRYGAGIVLNYSGAVIRNNIIIGNYGGEDYGGGGIWSLGNGTNPKLVENNTIVNNHSTSIGGGIRLWSTTMNITNCIIWGNTANNSPQIAGSTGIVSYSDVQGGYGGANNLDTDPMFTGDMYLLDEDSPCVDAGSEDPAFNDPEDPQNAGMALFPALGTVINDIGAYGGPGATLFPEVMTAISKLYGNGAESEIRIYPNPVCGGGVSIDINSPGDKVRNVAIIDVSGKIHHLVESVDMKTMPFEIRMPTLGKGIYLVKVVLESGRVNTEKLVVF